ncbi:MAG: ABC-type transport auxiliary lipoprotein family protein [Thermodesulfobacteriota bacterium]
MNITYTRYFYFFIFIFFLTTLGCAKLDKSYPERKFYVFNVIPETKSYTQNNHSVLEIRRFRVSPAYHGNQFVYRISSDGYESDFYNQFFRSPASLITQVVYKWLSKSSPFQYVVEAPSDVQPDYVLDGFVNAIYGDYNVAGSPKAVLTMQFFLIKEVSADNEIVFSKTYRQEVDIVSKSPSALVNGWNEALKHILTDFESDIGQHDTANPNSLLSTKPKKS